MVLSSFCSSETVPWDCSSAGPWVVGQGERWLHVEALDLVELVDWLDWLD